MQTVLLLRGELAFHRDTLIPSLISAHLSILSVSLPVTDTTIAENGAP